MLSPQGAPTLAATLLALCCLASACGTPGESSAKTPATAPTISEPIGSGVAVFVAASADTVSVGERLRVTLRVTDAAGATLAPHALDWSLGDSTVAGLQRLADTSATGGIALRGRLSDPAATTVLVTGVRPGTAVLTATADGRVATTTIVVAARSSVVSVRVEPGVDTLRVGESATLALAARDAAGGAAMPHDLAWSVSDSTVAGIGPAGTATPRGARVAGARSLSIALFGAAPGSATIVASADGQRAAATIVVLPRVASIRLRRDTVRLHVGESTTLVATALDESGGPIAGRVVAWRSVDTSVAVVAPNGVITARRPRLGAIVATVDGIVASVPVTVRPALGGVGDAAVLDVATYEGSGQVVHPDVIHFVDAWNGRRYWMAITPYPNANDQTENPSVFASDDGENWELPPGAVNPIAKPGLGHLSDPALVYEESSRRLLLYFREAVGGASHSRDDVYLTTSADGTTWTKPTIVYADTGVYVVSPSVVRGPDGRWRVWAVNAGVDGCRAGGTGVTLRTSTDGRRWGAPKPAALVQPDVAIWHIDVQWVAPLQRYVALYAAYAPAAGCGSTDLYLATSVDGERWTTYQTPVLAHGALPAFQLSVYRSTFAVDAGGDSLTLWFSGSRRDGAATRWSAAIARTSVASLLARVSTPGSTHAVRSVAPAHPPRRPDEMP